MTTNEELLNARNGWAVTETAIHDVDDWITNRTEVPPSKRRALLSSELYRNYLAFPCPREKLDAQRWGAVMTQLGYPPFSHQSVRRRMLMLVLQEDSRDT